MTRRKKSADHDFEVRTHWRPGERTPAWAELWRRILLEVLTQKNDLADTTMGEQVNQTNHVDEAATASKQ